MAQFAQNDIIQILDSSGNQVVSYEYDTWGKMLGISGSLASTIGEINPFRYRGYYYDSETGLYYLQSRYYDPQTGRFLNADSQLNTQTGVLGCNMFAYCENNPVNRADPSGQIWGAIAAAVVVVVVAVVVVANIVASVNETKRVFDELENLPEPSRDITEELDKKMKENEQYLINYQKKHGLMATNIEFKNKVKMGGEWDLKNNPEYYNGTFTYRGRTIQAQDIGNIHYGYIGTSMGFTRNTLLAAAGAVQTKRTWKMIMSKGDDLRDQIFVQYGIKLYHEEH